MKIMEETMAAVLADYKRGREIDALCSARCPEKGRLQALTELLVQAVFPGRSRDCPESTLEKAWELLREQALRVWEQDPAPALFRQLPKLRAQAQLDLEAAWEGDPAAESKEEILLCYPGIFAVTVYRLAHALAGLGLPGIPRIMTEYAHSVTGIDIHPGATIGSRFFIDHGTGIVIGQTTVIGDQVKLYQGVTLGGLSTRGGQSLRGTKRHPTIEDRVTIYANAAILGGDTVIGHDSVIGASAFITESVPPCTTVTNREQQLRFRPRSCRECDLADRDVKTWTPRREQET